MLLYGGLGLFFAGLIFMFGGTKFIKDAANAAKAKKQAPILALVGAGMLLLRFLIG